MERKPPLLHIRIGLAILQKTDGENPKGNFNALFAEESHRHGVYHYREPETYGYLFRKTFRYVQGRLSRKNRKDSRSIGEEILPLLKRDPNRTITATLGETH